MFRRTNLKEVMRAEVDSVRQEIDGHLDSINENTKEIQGIYDYLAEIESKVDKVSERMDQIDILINPSMESLSLDVKLNKREQEVFMSLYTANGKVTSRDLAQGLGFSEETVIGYLYNLIAKGVPIVKECVGGNVYLHLNSKFKELQAKKNILRIEEQVVKFSQI